MDGIRYWIETEGTGHWFFIAFPVALLALFIWFKGRRVRFLIPSLLISIVIINPWFYKYWDKLGLYAYWRILWVVPVVPVVAGLVPSITEKIQKSWIKAVVTVVGVSLIIFGGTFLYNGTGGSFVEAANAAKLPVDVVEIADHLLEIDDNPRVIAQDPIGVYIRQYTGQIDTLYGRDLQGYIASADTKAKRIHNELSSGDVSSVAQFMVDNDYKYLIYTGEVDDSFELIDKVNEYGIYTTHKLPTVTNKRNGLGQIVSVTTVNESGVPVNSEQGYSTIAFSYDDNGYVSREYHMNANGEGVTDSTGVAGHEWEYDSAGRILMERALGANKHPVVNYQNYAEIRYTYENDRVVREDYFGADGKPIKQAAGHVSMLQTNNNGRLVSRAYLNENGKPINRIDGYSRAVWESNDRGGTSIRFYNSDGEKVPLDGLNLMNEIVYDRDGWSGWMTPSPNMLNSLFNISTVNLGDKNAGDVYTCQIEIEFKDVSATEGQDFRFFTQGAQDGKWAVGNVWNAALIWMDKPPANGVYHFTSTQTVSEDMLSYSTFNIGFRCDYWKSGSFRVRRIKIEKGSTPTEWSPGV